jgi:hypothetical protein
VEFETEVELEFESTLLVKDRVKVKWSLELEVRDWGIKSFIVVVPEQTIHFEEQDGDDHIPREFVLKDVKLLGWEGNYRDLFMMTFAPLSLSVHKGKIRLDFGGRGYG